MVVSFDKITVVNCPGLTYFVARSMLLMRMTELLLKLDPFTTSVNEGALMLTTVGLISKMDGGDGSMVMIGSSTTKSKMFEMPPPGGGFATVMLMFPSVARSVLEGIILNIVLLTKTVEREAPLTRPTDVSTKFDPFTTN